MKKRAFEKNKYNKTKKQSHQLATCLLFLLLLDSPALLCSAFTFTPGSSPQALSLAAPLVSSMKPGPGSALKTRCCARLAGDGGVALAFGAWLRERQPPCLCWMNARMWARGKARLHWPQVRRSRPSSGGRTCGGGGGGGGGW